MGRDSLYIEKIFHIPRLERQLPQPFFIQDFHPAPGDLHKALAGEVFQHPRHNLPGGAHILGNLLVGEGDGVGTQPLRLVCQEDGQPLVHAHKEDLLHHPHHVGKATDGRFQGKDFDFGVCLADRHKGGPADDVALAVLLRVDHHVEGDGLQHAGGGKHAHVPGVQAV